MKSESPAATSSTEAELVGRYARPYVVTLCRLQNPVSIQPPRSPQLAAFTFFTSCLRRQNGSEQLYLHMGYFTTLSEAQRWTQRMRARYPHAIATPAPPIVLPQVDVSALQSTSPAVAPAPRNPPATDSILSDTQVMRLLETGSLDTAESNAQEHVGARVELLRPDDTQTRRSLKEAVVAGLPVPFAVQLEWSVQPIDAARVPRLDIFKGYTVYRTETRRAGRSCYFLRLGFFDDPLSAKEFACQVRSSFASAAVVPVTEQEFLHAGEARIDMPAPAGPLHHTDEMSAAPAAAAVTPISTVTVPADSVERSSPAPKQPAEASSAALDKTLEARARKNLWTQEDTSSDTGVRHLKITIKQRRASSARKQKSPIRLG